MYRVIYDAIDEIEAAMKGMLAPKFKEVALGQAEVREVYKITGAGIVAGCYVTGGQGGAQGPDPSGPRRHRGPRGRYCLLKRFRDDAKGGPGLRVWYYHREVPGHKAAAARPPLGVG